MAYKFRRFQLNRHEDVNDYSGTGIVVYGVQFPDGVCAYRWCTDKPGTTCIADSIQDIADIHGHDGATVVEWVDPISCVDGVCDYCQGAD